jgi:hypothetical protein
MPAPHQAPLDGDIPFDRLVTLTSSNGGSTWRRTTDSCQLLKFSSIAFAPDGSLLRWGSGIPPARPQVLRAFP